MQRTDFLRYAERLAPQIRPASPAPPPLRRNRTQRVMRHVANAAKATGSTLVRAVSLRRSADKRKVNLRRTADNPNEFWTVPIVWRPEVNEPFAPTPAAPTPRTHTPQPASVHAVTALDPFEPNAASETRPPSRSWTPLDDAISYSQMNLLLLSLDRFFDSSEHISRQQTPQPDHDAAPPPPPIPHHIVAITPPRMPTPPTPWLPPIPSTQPLLPAILRHSPYAHGWKLGPMPTNIDHVMHPAFWPTRSNDRLGFVSLDRPRPLSASKSMPRIHINRSEFMPGGWI